MGKFPQVVTMGKMTRRDFLKTAPALGAGLALGGKALAGEPYRGEAIENPYGTSKAEGNIMRASDQVSVLEMGYQGPVFSDQSDRSLEIKMELEHWLDWYGVPIVDSGAVLDELDSRGISYERFLQRPGIISRMDPQSELIRRTDAITGILTDHDDYHFLHGETDSLGNTTRLRNINAIRPDVVRARYIDLETGRVKTFEAKNVIELGQEPQMMKDLARKIACHYESLI